MRLIYKYVLAPKNDQVVRMPRGAKLLDVQLQDNLICLWAEVDTERMQHGVSFAVVGTGAPMPEFARCYVGTVQQGAMVWHIYHGGLML